MSELSEDFKALREHGREKRASNMEKSVAVLNHSGVAFEFLSPTHLRIGDYDFWPSTGLFINRKTQKRGRGVFRLLEKVKP